MKIVFSEINHLRSLGYREMITIEQNNLKSPFNGRSGPQYPTCITDVFKREFPVCDVAGG